MKGPQAEERSNNKAHLLFEGCAFFPQRWSIVDIQSKKALGLKLIAARRSERFLERGELLAMATAQRHLLAGNEGHQVLAAE